MKPWMKITRRGPRGERVTQSGLALLFAATIIAFVGVTATEFTYNTNIDYAQAMNSRDDMRAHFLARSGMNLSRIVIKVQNSLVDKMDPTGAFQLADYLPMLVGIFGGSKEEVNDFANMIGGIDTSAIKGLGLPAGEFEIEVTTEDNKINVNCANNAKKATLMATMISAMILPKGYDLLFQERDGDGQFTDREMFVKAIIDWIDADEAGYGASGQPEDYGYESRTPPYKARNSYIDSVDELQLVRGMDEKRWALFGPAFTAYGSCKVNLSALTDLNLILGILISTAKNDKDPMLNDLPRLWTLAGIIAQARSWGLQFENTQKFVDFAKDPMAEIGALLGSTGANGQPAAIPGIPAGTIQGIELDKKKLDDLARIGSRETYRVVTTARIGKVEKRIIGVWYIKVQQQDRRTAGTGQQGAWVYWREE
jgi:type II secretory pathway component PulK